MNRKFSNMFPANHKTIFVLDHTPHFGSSYDSVVELDVGNKPRGMSMIPLSPIFKSLWTASVEAALEYCRVVWDLFPERKYCMKTAILVKVSTLFQIRFVVSDIQGHVLNSWSPMQQNLAYIQNQLGMIGVPNVATRPVHAENSVVPGLQAAVDSICQCTDIQHELRTSLSENASKILNRSRVICITSQRDNQSIKHLQDSFTKFVSQANKKAANSDTLIPINHCHLVILNVTSRNGEPCLVNPIPPTDISSTVTSEVHAVLPNGNIAVKLSHLILQHYDLASTTVTNIPMKEEQNASSSANYDVEIFHLAEAHASILKGSAQDTALVKTVREGREYDTVTLKWCTPKASAAEMHHCTAMHRITPVDVNSRPSSCLINFLLNGRSVMLEMPRKNGGKVSSHMLAAHGGEIFVHTLGTSRSVLEDPPSISEGPGGRVTDYRITDFGQLMKKNKLLPLKRKRNEESKDDISNLDRMRQRLERFTKHWPITISSTSVFNLRPDLDPLLNAIVKETISEEEVLQCKQVILNLVAQESRNEPLQPSQSGQRTKGPKRDEQYRQMFTELETLIRSHCRSDQHTAVLNCLLDCRNRSDDDPKVKLDRKDDKVELDQALRELDQMAASPSASVNGQRVSVIRATTDSPMSPPPMSGTSLPLSSIRGQTRSTTHSIYSSGHRTVLDFLISSDSKANRPEFHGLLNSDVGPNGNKIAKLYAHLNSQEGGRGDSSMNEGE
ncbi:Integrator complex subunit 13 [Frankliniella fusca]|uniref:Protein asunder n=1 Tax=Frankliniella fusca TaxID=407009 RepID=A0AAE1HUR3_9NEOP|nr:Integrator complex subunit 13 [Frankliniella fusca]